METSLADIFLWLIHIPWWVAVLLLILIGIVVYTLIVFAIKPDKKG